MEFCLLHCLMQLGSSKSAKTCLDGGSGSVWRCTCHQMTLFHQSKKPSWYTYSRVGYHRIIINIPTLQSSLDSLYSMILRDGQIPYPKISYQHIPEWINMFVCKEHMSTSHHYFTLPQYVFLPLPNGP